MTDEQRHPQEPAEGAEEDVGTPGADRPGNGGKETEGAPDEARRSKHPEEPAEGAEEDEETPGAERPGDKS